MTKVYPNITYNLPLQFLGPHPDLGDTDLLSVPEDDLIALGHRHRHHHHHNLCNHHRLCLNGGTCIHHRHSRVRCSCKPGFHGHYCESKYNIGLVNDNNSKGNSMSSTPGDSYTSTQAHVDV